MNASFIEQIGGLNMVLGYVEGITPDIKNTVLKFLDRVEKELDLTEESGLTMIQINIKDKTVNLDIVQKRGDQFEKMANVISIGEILFPPVFDFFINLQNKVGDGNPLVVEILKFTKYHPKDVKKTKPKTFVIVALTPLDDLLNPIKTLTIEQFVSDFVKTIKKGKKRIASKKK